VLLVETDAAGFEFLGNLFLAFARSDEGCNRHLSPDSAGSAYFREGTVLGLLLHRLPCDHPEAPSRIMINACGKRVLDKVRCSGKKTLLETAHCHYEPWPQ
jgi:hypothetical protein